MTCGNREVKADWRPHPMPQPRAIRRAAMVLPVPGGPHRRTLRRGAPREVARATLEASSSTWLYAEHQRVAQFQGGAYSAPVQPGAACFASSSWGKQVRPHLLVQLPFQDDIAEKLGELRGVWRDKRHDKRQYDISRISRMMTRCDLITVALYLEACRRGEAAKRPIQAKGNGLSPEPGEACSGAARSPATATERGWKGLVSVGQPGH